MNRWRARIRVIGCWVMLAGWLSACGGGAEQQRPDEGAAVAPVAPPPPAVGPIVQAEYSMMAETLQVVEGVSLWRRDLPRDLYRAWDERFGIDEPSRELLKKFAFARSSLLQREMKALSEQALTFERPFGPEGRLPAAEPGLSDRFSAAVLAASEPAAVKRSLAGICEPADAEALGAALAGLAPHVGEIAASFGGWVEEAAELRAALAAGGLPNLLDSLGRFAGLDPRAVTVVLHPVWVPPGGAPWAALRGGRILVGLVEGEPLGPTQVALVVREVFRAFLARLPAASKSQATVRFAEAAGLRESEEFPLLEGLLDAAGYGLAAPLAAAGPAEVPGWPGDERRQRLAEALTGLLRDSLKAGKKFDGEFALKAGRLQAKVNSLRPAELLTGAMVIAQEPVLEPFKSEVVRWVVWKYPPTKKYNYPAKLDEAPGRTVLMVLSPKDIKQLTGRFPGRPQVVAGLEKSLAALKRAKGVITTLPRESRGYIFILAAHDPQAMGRVAKAFFALDKVPKDPIEVK